MAFVHQTPEILLGRSDSRNPATTCRGLTTAGNPCRSSLATSTGPKGITLRPGLVALSGIKNHGTFDAAYFCWQHKDQAVQVNAASRSRPPKIVSITERTSIDSLVDRIGVLRLESSEAPLRNRKESDRSPSTTRVHPKLHHPQATRATSSREEKHSKHQQPRRGFLASLCCFGGVYEEDDFRPRARPDQHRRSSVGGAHAYREKDVAQWPVNAPISQAPSFTPSRAPISRRPLASLPTNQAPVYSPFTQRKSQPNPIPSHLDRKAVVALSKELLKPISPHDEEGYIYIFWLTDTETARTQQRDSLLEHGHGWPTRSGSSVPNSRILVKIGRASNVHRRMSEWTQQCGYALSLLRWYPYMTSPSSTPRRAADSTERVRKVPHVHRVERLIHLELASQRVRRHCAACKKEHREWFEIAATEEGIKAVDATVRRWVSWAERLS